MTIIERFTKKINKLSNGCWQWLGFVQPNGYGQFSVGKNTRLAHRVSYELFVDVIPNELQIDHLCNKKDCVNPKHLEPVTQSENMIRSFDRGRVVGGISRQEFCKKGHALVDSNVYIKPNGKRNCKTCRAEASTRFKLRSLEYASNC